MAWKDMVRGCFGVEDKEFAGHAFDKGRATEMLKAALDEGATWEQVETEIRTHLKGSLDEHIEKQLKRARDVSSYLA